MLNNGNGTACDSVTVIARSTTDRFLARCTCGCLHLVWDSASLSLLADDLHKLLKHPPQVDQSVAAVFEMREDPYGGYQVWAGAGGIRVNQREMRDLVILLHQGAAHLKDDLGPQTLMDSGPHQLDARKLTN